MTGRRKGLLTAGLIVTALAASVGSAQGAVTIGSNLTAPLPFDNLNCNSPCTAVNLNLPATSQAPGGLNSPVNGTVTSWRAKANVTDRLTLRVLRQTGGLSFTAAATGAEFNSAGSDTGQVATSLPIAIGDTIGLNSAMGRLIEGETTGATMGSFVPPLADGATLAATAVPNREVLVQATIEPTNTVTAGTIVRNKKKGTATVTITVPNAGQLSYTGTGVNVTGPASIAAPGDVQVTVRATGKKRKKLNKKGKVSVSFGTTFTPNFGAAGITPTNLTLRKKLKKK
jgi:hypothetical protein